MGLERLIKEANEEEKRKINEYHDVDQIIKEEVYDHKGSSFLELLIIDVEQIEDSDEELDAIIETDQIFKDLYENPKEASHTKIIKLFKNLKKIEDMLEFYENPEGEQEGSVIQEVLSSAVSPQIPVFSDVDDVIKIAEIAFEIGMPSKDFWNSISHFIAVNHEDIDTDKIVKLMYFLYRHDPTSKIQVNKDYIEGDDLDKERVLRRYSYDFVMTNLRNEIDEEIQDLNTSTAFRMIDLLHILYLNNVCKLDLLMDEFWEEKIIIYLDRAISGAEQFEDEFKDDSTIVDEYIDSLNQFSKDYKFVHLLDLLEMVLEFKSTLTNKPDLLKFIVYQILENIKDPDFYSGSRIGSKIKNS